MVDNLIQGKTRARREFCSFYTESDPILTYMVKRLGVVHGDSILEPCAGDGIFIEKLLTSTSKNFHIEAVDLNPKAVAGLKKKFSTDSVTIRQADTLLDFNNDLFGDRNFFFNKIIGNPPYGAWQDLKKRELLKNIYGGYVKETYTLFLRKCIDLLKENGRLVFIVPDTFLALHMHKNTREKILNNTKIEEIVLMPSSFFPGVNFGYSNLCIISLVKSVKDKDNVINIVSIKNSIDDLYEIADGNYSVVDHFQSVPQDEILRSTDYAFLLGGNKEVRSFIKESKVKLGDIADCVTGFCSGDNKKYIRAKNSDIKGAKGYLTASPNEVEFNFLDQENLLEGLNSRKKYIPFLKSANSLFLKQTEWFVQWDKDTVHDYKNNKVSRFQNSKFYFREGIGVPMVKSAKIHAILLKKRLFDQSIVGVFPKDKKYQNYLLAFLNSDACSRLVKIINHTANNSANYLKRLPIIIEEKSLKEINSLVKEMLGGDNLEPGLVEINKIFNRIYEI